MCKRSEQNLTKEDRQIVKKLTKRFSTSFFTRELKIKTTMKYYYACVRMAETQNTGDASEYVEQK